MSHTAESSPTHSPSIAYLVWLAGISAALHIWKLPPSLPILQSQLGLNLVESGFLLSLVQLGGMTLGLLVGLVAEKVGLRRCVLAGLALLTVSSVLGAVFSTKEALLLFRALEGCGMLMVTMPAPPLIRRLVPPSYLSRLMGVWGCYIPVGTVIILLGGSWLLTVSTWQFLWELLGLVTLLMAGAVWRWIPPDSTRRHCSQDARPAAASSNSAWGMVRDTLSCLDVWLVALSFGAYSGQWIAVIGFLPSIYVAAGISGTAAGMMTAVVAGSNALGNLAGGRSLHRGVKPRTLLCTGFSAMAVTAFVAFGLDVPASVKFVAVILFSGIGGLIPSTLFLLAIQLAPSLRTTTTSVGWVQQLSALGQFGGPPLVAWVATLTGGWQWTWLATGSSALAGIAMAFVLGRRR